MSTNTNFNNENLIITEMGFVTGKQLSKAGLFQFIEQNIGSYQLIITINLKIDDDDKKHFYLIV